MSEEYEFTINMFNRSILLNGTTSSMKSLVAYEKIRDMILTGEKLPGTRLVIQDLESELGIGRGPIREAIMRLDRSGLVKNVPYKGALVASPPSQKEIYIIFDLRVDLETQLLLEALDKFKPEDIAELENIYNSMLNMEKDYYQLDRHFHSIIYHTADMPHIFSIVAKLIESVETFLTLRRQELTDCHLFTEEHGLILTAIKSKDKDLAKTVMRKNIQRGLEVVERTFPQLMGR
jgi:DNA-binding GntR family transcriptional regulator